MQTAPSSLTKVTYRWDLVRGGLFGVLDMIIQSFAILVAIRIFDTPDMVKPYVPAAYFFGYLLTPLVIWIARRTGCRMSVCASMCYIAGGSMLGLAAMSTDTNTFLLGTVAALAVFAQLAPLMTGIYSSNYPPTERGQRLSTSLVLTGVVGSLCAWLAGRVMDIHPDYWRMVFTFGAVASFVSAYTVIKIPSVGHKSRVKFRPFGQISLMWKDRVFGLMLLGWMFIGFGNLMMMPLRVEYVANPVHGILASNELVALLTVTLPRLFSLLSVKGWGWAFDRWNLISMRLTINALIMGSILFYFFSTNLIVLACSSAMLGLAIGGAGVIWPLWVTRVAPEGKVEDYMGIHTMTTGLRGITAPFLGFFLISDINPQMAGLVGAGLILISCIIFIPLHRDAQIQRI